MSEPHSMPTSPPYLLRRHLTGASQKRKMCSTSHIPNPSPQEVWQLDTKLPNQSAAHGKVRGNSRFCAI